MAAPISFSIDLAQLTHQTAWANHRWVSPCPSIRTIGGIAGYSAASQSTDEVAR
jgi:hypothetical protein